MNINSQRTRRGHDFIPAKAIKWPGLYDTEHLELEHKMFVAHYFVGGCDWYVTEYDRSTHQAFGWAELTPGGGEWGYFDLAQLESLNIRGQVVERDLDYQPTAASTQLANR